MCHTAEQNGARSFLLHKTCSAALATLPNEQNHFFPAKHVTGRLVNWTVLFHIKAIIQNPSA